MPRVYLLSPQRYPPEVIAVAFAKASRSPQPLDVTAEELSEPESARFHEKWVIGYGHASVAEHAVLHLAIEGASRLAIEVLESNRLASYTEKSSRYQPFGPEDFVTPPELKAQPALQARYRETMQTLYGAYQRCLTKAREHIARQFPKADDEPEARWDARHRSKYADVCRFLLPAAAQATVGMTINARALAHALRKMLSHPLAEVREIGLAIQQVAEAETPTLVRYVTPVQGWQALAEAMQRRTAAFRGGGTYADEWCHLVSWEPKGEVRVLAALLYQYGDRPYVEYFNYVRGLAAEARRALAAEALAVLDRRDMPPRALEYASFTFDLTMDQGAYYEFKRHRMMTQTPQPLTTRLGYAVPRLISEIGLEADYHRAMQEAAATFEALAAWNADVAAYVVPNAFNRRVLASFNLREAFHFLRLRTAPNAHFSMRRVAWRIAEEISAVTPTLAAFLDLPPGETWQTVEKQYFSATAWQ